MSVRVRASRRRRIATGINLTSLLDAIFNLVFFFLLATTLRREEGQARVQLPESGTAVVAKSEQHIVSIDAGGRVFYSGQEVKTQDLERILRGLSATGVHEITIRGDAHVDLGRVYEVMDICRNSGLDAVSLLAERKL